MNFVSTIHAPCGSIRGGKEDGVYIYKNIPFASMKRWEAPVMVEQLDREAGSEEYGFAPIQPPPAPFWAARSGEPLTFPQSEDCLNLNIWTADPERPKKAVLFWVYGGSYIQGYNYKKGYLPQNFIKAHPEILVIAPNYRVGLMGSMNLSHVTREEKYQFSNNLALLDILCALRWTRKNIEAFGGDPENVTMYGHSAGSNAISHLMAMPMARGLFRRTICQSSFMTDLGTVAYDTSEEIGQKVLELAGVHTLEEALALSAEQVLAVQKQLFSLHFGGSHASKLFSPVEDGLVVKKDPFRAFASGEFNGSEAMIGGSAGEYDQMFRGKTLEECIQFVIARNQDKHVTREDVAAFLALHPEMDPREAVMSIHNELGLSLGGEWIGRAICRKIPVYEYQFQLREDGGKYRAAHGAPSNYVFGTIIPGDAPEEMEPRMMDTWAAFISTGNPNNRSIPTWHRYMPDGEVMVMDTAWKATDGFWKKDFAFWRGRFAANRILHD
jgi:para-nitrobenzyl esterase